MGSLNTQTQIRAQIDSSMQMLFKHLSVLDFAEDVT